MVANTDYTGTFNLSTGVCTINGTSRSNGGSPFSSTNTIPIFQRKNVGVVQTNYAANMRLYFFRIYQGNTLAHDYIPVRIGQEGCLYDKVTGAVLRNAGTGSFGIPTP